MSLPSPERKQQFVERMFDRIAPRYDLLNRLMTFGIDRSWRRRLIEGLGLGPGATVVDLGCGTGDLLEEVRRRGGKPIGVDLSAGMLALARKRQAEFMLIRGDAACLPLKDACADGVVSAFALRNFVSIPGVLAEAARVLRSGGRLGILEVDRPRAAWRRLAFDTYFTRVVPLLGGLLSRREAYRYLSASLAYLPEEAELAAMLKNAGFTDVTKRSLTGGAAQFVLATRASAAGGQG